MHLGVNLHQGANCAYINETDQTKVMKFSAL